MSPGVHKSYFVPDNLGDRIFGQTMVTAALPRNPAHELPHAIGMIPSVTRIFAAREGNVVSVWTVVDRFDRDIRFCVYEAEREMFAMYPGVKFDFNIVPESEDLDISDAELVYVR